MEQRYGPGTFPEVSDYCLTVLKESVKDDQIGGLYLNLAIQQLGIGREFTLTGDAGKVGDKDVQIMRNARAAAEAGYTAYVGADGKAHELTCPMALDAGLTWASAKAERVSHNAFSDEQIDRMAVACYDPSISEVNLRATGEKLTIQQAGVRVGEMLGHKYSAGRPGG